MWTLSLIHISTLADEVYHNTIGIVGFGNIGRGVAKRLQGWDCTLIAYDPYVTQEQADALGWNVKMVDWETLFTTSDAITIHTPLNEETRGFVGENCLLYTSGKTSKDWDV